MQMRTIFLVSEVVFYINHSIEQFSTGLCSLDIEIFQLFAVSVHFLLSSQMFSRKGGGICVSQTTVVKLIRILYRFRATKKLDLCGDNLVYNGKTLCLLVM